MPASIKAKIKVAKTRSCDTHHNKIDSVKKKKKIHYHFRLATILAGGGGGGFRALRLFPPRG